MTQYFSLEGLAPGKPMRYYRVVEPMEVGKAHLKAGATISYDPARNEFTLRGSLEFDPWEEQEQEAEAAG